MHRFVFALCFIAVSTAHAGRVVTKFEVVPDDIKTKPHSKEEKAEFAALVEKVRTNLGLSRDAHAKSHGCVDDVDVTVRKDLPREWQHGFFQAGREYKAVVRFSPGDGSPKADDREFGANGFALKILLDRKEDIEKLLPLQGENEFYVPKKYYQTFDILTISRNQEFFVNKAQDYDDFFAAGAASRAAFGKATQEGKSVAEAKAAAGAALFATYIPRKDGTKRLLEKALLENIGKARGKNVLLERYNSWVPSLYGPRPVKYQIARCEGLAVDAADAYKVPEGVADVAKDPNFQSKILAYELEQKPTCFTLSVQPYVDGFAIEDAAAAWPEAKSKYVPIAEIRIPKKDPSKALMSNDFCEAASFHPGHSSAEHDPIGNVQRARVGYGDLEGIYTMTAKVRNQKSKRPQVKN